MAFISLVEIGVGTIVFKFEKTFIHILGALIKCGYYSHGDLTSAQFAPL